MREIKFRQLINSKFVLKSLKDKIERWHYFDLVTHACNINEHPIICQFTGLLDKNGKEIYQGDIVKIKNYVNNAIIEWKDLSWNITPSGWNSYTLHQFHSSRLEIVGNIYENPELLNRIALS